MDDLEEFDFETFINNIDNLSEEIDKAYSALSTTVDFHDQVLEMGVSKGIASSVEALTGEPLHPQLPLSSYTIEPSNINRKVALESIVVSLFKFIGKVVELILKLIGKILEYVGKSIQWIVNLGKTPFADSTPFSSSGGGGGDSDDSSDDKPESKTTDESKSKIKVNPRKKGRDVKLGDMVSLKDLVNTKTPKNSDAADFLLATLKKTGTLKSSVKSADLLNFFGDDLKGVYSGIDEYRKKLFAVAYELSDSDLNGVIKFMKENLEKGLAGIDDTMKIFNASTYMSFGDTTLNIDLTKVIHDGYTEISGQYGKFKGLPTVDSVAGDQTNSVRNNKIKFMVDSVAKTKLPQDASIDPELLSDRKLGVSLSAYRALKKKVKHSTTELGKIEKTIGDRLSVEEDKTADRTPDITPEKRKAINEGLNAAKSAVQEATNYVKHSSDFGRNTIKNIAVNKQASHVFCNSLVKTSESLRKKLYSS